MTGYTPPPTITDIETTGKVLRGLEHLSDARRRGLAGLHPATLGCAVENLIDLIVTASGGDQSRVEDALRNAKRRMERVLPATTDEKLAALKDDADTGLVIHFDIDDMRGHVAENCDVEEDEDDLTVEQVKRLAPTVEWNMTFGSDGEEW